MPTTTLTSRKKANPEMEPLTDPESAEVEESREEESEGKEKKLGVLDKSIVLLFVLVTILTLMIFAAPKQLRERRNKVITRHFHQAANLVKDQRESLEAKYREITHTISEDELLKHKDEIEQLHSTVSGKQSEIDKLNKDIAAQKKKLAEVNQKMKVMQDEALQFCPDCVITFRDTKFKCGDRANYIINTYGDDEMDVKEGMVRDHPECKINNAAEKENEDKKEKTLEFCPECITVVQGKAGSKNFKCGARLDFAVSKHKRDEKEVKDEMMKEHPECTKQSN